MRGGITFDIRPPWFSLRLSVARRTVGATCLHHHQVSGCLVSANAYGDILKAFIHETLILI